jgi:hypothetical protein
MSSCSILIQITSSSGFGWTKKLLKDNSLRKIDVDNSLQSNRFPLDQCFSKWDEIQHQSLRCVTDILVPLLEWHKTQVGGSDRKLIVDADNARLHTARVTLEFLKHTGMKRAPHPPYSSDLAPSDFYLLSLISSVTSSNSWHDTNSLIGKRFSRQSDTFWKALKKLP